MNQERLFQLDEGAREVILSINPKAGGRSGKPHVEGLVDALARCDFQVTVLSDIERVRAEAAEKHRQGTLRAVVAGGGDGTVSLVVNSLPAGVPVTVLPLGTENLLSKYMGIPQDPAKVCQIIRDGRGIRLDAGLANGRLFLLMAGCGFDAEVVRRLHENRTGHIQHLSYLKPIFDSIRSYQYPELRIYSDRREAESHSDAFLKAKWAFVINLPRYAGGLSLAPSANGTDGLLDVCTFREGSLWNGLLYLAGVIAGQHSSWEDCKIVSSKWIRIESDQPAPYQLDGDPGGFLPLEIEVLPGRLTLLAPSAWLDRQKPKDIPTET